MVLWDQACSPQLPEPLPGGGGEGPLSASGLTEAKPGRGYRSKSRGGFESTSG